MQRSFRQFVAAIAGRCAFEMAEQSEWDLNGRLFYVAMAYGEQDRLEYRYEHGFTPCYALQAAIETDNSVDDNLLIDAKGRIARVRANWRIGLPRYEDTGMRLSDLQPAG